MTCEHVYQSLLKELTPVYGEREASNIAKYYLEDVFNATNPLSVQELSGDEIEKFKIDLLDLVAGKPLQYVTGLAWFYDLKFKVNEHVLIPRPETEELVDRIIKDHKDRSSKLNILEIGTGSGCIAITLAKHLSQALIIATDISSAALDCARENAKHHDVTIKFKEHNWLEQSASFLEEKIDCIVSNPPYIDINEKEQMGASVLKHEPHTALFAEDHGLAFYKAIADFVKQYTLQPTIYLELNEFKANEILEVFAPLYDCVELVNDLQGKSRVLVAKMDS